MKKLRVIFAGGGTGGHLFPALAIADKLKSKIVPEYEPDFRFVGTKRGLEYRMKDKLGYPLHLLSVRGFVRSAILANIIFPFVLIGAVVKSLYLILRYHPDIVIGTGGYVMGPVIIAAIVLNTNRVIQEQNSYPGVTTRTLAGKVFKVFLGFQDAVKHLKPGCDTVVTGNPIKEIIGTIPREKGVEYFGLDSHKKTILIFGGSQGAGSININISEFIDTLPDGFQLIWQTGERVYKDVAARAGGRVADRALFSFTERMEMAYAAADLVIARAGALTLAEIEAAELPSILVPFPFAAGDHQRKNAESFVTAGAAMLIDDEKLLTVNLLEEAVRLMQSDSFEKMRKAVQNMKAARERSAADIITDEVLKLVGIMENGE